MFLPRFIDDPCTCTSAALGINANFGGRAQALIVLLLLSLNIVAQPQVDPIRTVENITPITNAYGQKANDLREASNGIAAIAYREDSLLLTLLGQEVTPSYLVDNRGGVWNLGVMDQPFVVPR